jgi:hypothetical protein
MLQCVQGSAHLVGLSTSHKERFFGTRQSNRRGCDSGGLLSKEKRLTRLCANSGSCYGFPIYGGKMGRKTSDAEGTNRPRALRTDFGVGILVSCTSIFVMSSPAYQSETDGQVERLGRSLLSHDFDSLPTMSKTTKLVSYPWPSPHKTIRNILLPGK